MEPKKPIRIEELTPEHPLKQLPFTVPEGYFDTLPSRIQTETVTRSHRFGISWSWQRTAATLAGAGLVAALVWITYPPKQGPLGPDMLSEVSDAAIAKYLDEQALSDEVLADVTVLDEDVASDSTMIYFLDVSPGAIRQQLESEPVFNENTDS